VGDEERELDSVSAIYDALGPRHEHIFLRQGAAPPCRAGGVMQITYVDKPIAKIE